ncbi:response regulator transcription factor [Pseudobdellovibrio exovorus]|uniref:DNA-binding response regulator n=1 Tax=Pseudobdellovibrio exovorus JSS TaxID=1184267 RepID=M4V6C1_9BACT|nr:response regulator transcription factor [Pseudobdellovibrio exovorus]AGH94922.1 hypothetical protein A11Q_702 [Pseudobdellovibrio exovorus JSS]
MQIHIVEDDPVLARGLQVNLELEGHQVVVSHNIKSAIEVMNTRGADFVILDLGLPDGSGFDFLKNIREVNNQTPVIILTAQTDEDSVIKGLQLGANDYMKKPYSFRELLARMHVILRKPIGAQNTVSFDQLSLNKDARMAKFGEYTIELNRREFDILAYFVQRAEMIVTREALVLNLDKDSEIFDRTIDSHISHLRKKFRKVGVNSIRIASVYGLGYRLEKVSDRSGERNSVT